ncbi:MAG: hypothetical protein BGO01_05865 [Armatimonadetes bacterium 55-13]|nr:hypothetical protein [Armatimonadota bacterium]OJU61594.1 MAG: hypothetical protein BGO01_05865 [Armatimonadetes bacterium 55-13]
MAQQQKLSVKETAFEKQRGISQIDVRGGFAQVHVSRLKDPLVESRLQVLKAVAEAGVSVDFMKLTPSGVSFLIAEANSGDVEAALENIGVHYTIRKDRCVVLVHAVNMRDEEGLTASVVQQAIASGAIVDHISDMHDRMLIVVESKFAETLASQLKEANHVGE